MAETRTNSLITVLLEKLQCDTIDFTETDVQEFDYYVDRASLNGRDTIYPTI